jgi:hypothetical protein
MEHLTLNYEYDGSGNIIWCAMFYSPEIGRHTGQGLAPHLAVIALSQTIMEWDLNKCRKQGTPLFFEQAKALTAEDFSKAYTRAMNQPRAHVPIIPADAQVDYYPQAPSVGRIVWYYPDKGEIDGVNPGQYLPAVITKVVDKFTVNLNVFPDKHGMSDRFVPGVDFRGANAVPVGVWTWPEKQ